MTEFAGGDNPQGLSQEQSDFLRGQLATLMGPYEAGFSGSEPVCLHETVVDAIAHTLIDDVVKQPVADAIINYHAETGDVPVQALPIYLSVIKRAVELSKPNAPQLPETLVLFVTDLAQKDNDIVTVAELVLLTSDPGDAAAAAEIHEPDLLALKTGVNLDFSVARAYITLSEVLESSNLALLNGQVPEHMADLGLLLLGVDQPDRLLAELEAGQFKTTEGIANAEALQDSDRLLRLVDQPDQLLQELRAGNFKSRYGRRAAKLQQDAARLNLLLDDAPALFEDITNNCFETDQGKAAARAQQDCIRLLQHKAEPRLLQFDLYTRRFLTPEGIARAVQIINSAAA